MNISAIICEYNPFHNGHALHIARAKEASGADAVVCAMSGSWMQRGEPAIVDKWTRAACALEAGADIVLELPAAWAVRAAGDFAAGAVRLLDALGVCTHLSFGSELPMDALCRELERGEDEASIRQALSLGQSYPRAVGAGEAASHPNATLGLEYIRALQATGSRMQPVLVRRDVPHDASSLGAVTSASRIRQGMRAGEDVARAMPPAAHARVKEAMLAQGGPAGWEALAPLVLHRLRGTEPDAMRGAYGVAEGLERRIARAAREAASVGDLFDRVKCKRYTHARIRRAVAHILLGIPPDVAAAPPSYARVLAFRRDASALLGRIGERASIPLITKLPREAHDPLLRADIAAQELWALACPRPANMGMDHSHPIVIL